MTVFYKSSSRVSWCPDHVTSLGERGGFDVDYLLRNSNMLRVDETSVNKSVHNYNYDKIIKSK